MERIPEGYNGMPDSLNPANAYSVAKRAAEHLCALYQDRHGLQTIVARCFAFVGRDLPLDVHFAIGNFIRDALYRDSITVASDGTAVRSYLDQRDLALWLLTLLERGRGGRAYNVGSDQAITIANLADQVRDLLSPGKPVYILGKADFSGARSRYVPDISRARTELGLDVTIPLAEAIRATAEAAQL
jgi:dTDP-glucose 4,6-dehydratase